MNQNSIALAQQYTDRDVIEAVVNNYFILDYGVISKLNADGTVNVTHAKLQEFTDGTKLPALETKNLELLTFSTAGLSIYPDTKAGDKVLLLGLKDYIPSVDDVSGATKQDAYVHYKRDSMKALPLCVFDSNAKCKVECEDGTMKLTATKLEVNGNTKQFVTWAELNQALTTFVTQLNTALLAATYVNAAGTPTPLTWTGGTPPSTLDISGAKTTTVSTGG